MSEINYGIESFKQYTFDGLMNAGFLFQAMAGDLTSDANLGSVGGLSADPVMALHYLTVTLALVGGFILLLNKKCHTPITALSWLFLVILCITGPTNTVNSPFFTSLNNSNAADTQKGFTPQVKIVDMMSKIHSAVYVALFDYEGNGKSSVRNYVSAISRGAGTGVLPDANFNKDGDIHALLASYGAFCTGGALNNKSYNSILYPFANSAMEKAFKRFETGQNSTEWVAAINRLGGSPDMGHQSLQDTAVELEKKGFSLGELIDTVKAYHISHTPGHPPYGIYYKNKTDFLQDFSKAGLIDTDISNPLVDKYAEGAIETYEKLEAEKNNLPYLFTSWDDISKDSDSVFHSDFKERIFLTPRTGSSSEANNKAFELGNTPYKNMNYNVGTVILDNNGMTTNNNRDIARSIIFGTKAGTNPFNTSNIDGTVYTEYDKDVGLWTNTLRSARSFLGKAAGTEQDPARYRILSPRSSFPNEDEQKAIDNLYQKDLRSTELSLGFVLDAPIDTLKVATKFEKCAVGRDCTTYNSSKYFVKRHLKVSNCAQLHHVINTEAASRAVFHSSLPGELLDSTAFYKTFGEPNSFEQANKKIKVPNGCSNFYCKYKAWAKYKSELGGNLGDYYRFLDSNVELLRRANPTTHNWEETQHIFEEYTSETDRKHVVEFIRQAMLATITSTTMAQTTQSYPPLNIHNVTLNEAMTSHFTSGTVSDRLSGLSDGSRLLGAIGEAISKVGLWWDSQFEGAEAIVYTAWITKLTGLAIFLVLLATPLLYLIGLVNPSQAPGIIINSLLLLLVLKMVPITYTLIDFAVSYTMQSSMMFTDSTPIFGHFNSDLDAAMMVYVIAGAYSSVVVATLFILFKAGDTNMVMNQLGQLDGQANKIASKSVDAAQTIATAALTVAGAGAVGAIGGGAALLGSSAGKSAAGAASKVMGRSALNAFNKLPSGRGDFISGGIAEAAGEMSEGRKDYYERAAKRDMATQKLNAEGKEVNEFNIQKALYDMNTEGAKGKALKEAREMAGKSFAYQNEMHANEKNQDYSWYQEQSWDAVGGANSSRISTKAEEAAFKRFEGILEKYNETNGTDLTMNDLKYSTGEMSAFKNFASKLGETSAINTVVNDMDGAFDEAFLERSVAGNKTALKRQAKTSDAFSQLVADIKTDKAQIIENELTGREKNIANSNSYEITEIIDGKKITKHLKPKPESTVDMTGSAIRGAKIGDNTSVQDLIAEKSGISGKSLSTGLLKELAEKQSASYMGAVRRKERSASINGEELANENGAFQSLIENLEKRGGTEGKNMAKDIRNGKTGQTLNYGSEAYNIAKKHLDAANIGKGPVDTISIDELFSTSNKGRAIFEKEAEKLADAYIKEHQSVKDSRRRS